MKKGIRLVATTVVALIMALTMATLGCAPAKTDSSSSSSGTSFFPNVSL